MTPEQKLLIIVTRLTLNLIEAQNVLHEYQIGRSPDTSKLITITEGLILVETAKQLLKEIS